MKFFSCVCSCAVPEHGFAARVTDNKTGTEINSYLEKGQIVLCYTAVLCRCKLVGVGERQATQNAFFSCSPFPLSPLSVAAGFPSDGAVHLHSSVPGITAFLLLSGEC